MINPNKCYNDSGVFGLTFKGTTAQLAAVPDGIWTPAEGDHWYDTTDNVWKTYDGTTWNIDGQAGSAAGTGLSPLVWDGIPFQELLTSPELGFAYFDNFMGPVDATTGDGYIITQVNSGVISGSEGEEGGALLVDSDGNNAADDGVNVQLPNCLVLPAAGKTIVFEARIKMNETGGGINQFYIGLAEIHTALIASGVLDDTFDKCGFFRQDDTTADRLESVTSKKGVDDITADVAIVADNTYVKLGIVIDGLTSVKFYVDGVLVETGVTTTSIPTRLMCLSFVAQVQNTTRQAEIDVDWVAIAQINA
jgi:hypothetical protein